VRVTEEVWKATCLRERWERCESDDQVSHVNSPDRRKAANATQNAALRLIPFSPASISRTTRQRMSEVRGYLTVLPRSRPRSPVRFPLGSLHHPPRYSHRRPNRLSHRSRPRRPRARLPPSAECISLSRVFPSLLQTNLSIAPRRREVWKCMQC
jgi:hypothetical protein